MENKQIVVRQLQTNIDYMIRWTTKQCLYEIETGKRFYPIFTAAEVDLAMASGRSTIVEIATGGAKLEIFMEIGGSKQ